MQTVDLQSRQGRGILAATIMVSGMAAFLGRTISIALPAIQASFHASISDIQWIISAYSLVLSIFTLLSGKICDSLGTRKVFIGGLLLFSLGALLSALSQTILQLILSQVVLGLGGVFMLPAGLAVINLSYRDDQKGRAIGLWAGLGAGFGVLGLLTGGFIVEYLGWRSGFLAMLPIGAATLWLAVRSIPALPATGRLAINIPGSVALSLGLLGISYALIYGPVRGWLTLTIMVPGLLGLIAMWIFRQSERTSSRPLIPADFFHINPVVWPNLITFFLYFSLNGLYVFLILFFQQLFGYAPGAAGMAMLPPSLAVMILSSYFGKLGDRLNPKLLLAAGTGLTTLGMLLLLTVDIEANYFSSFLPRLLLIGLGMSMFVAPITKLAVAVTREYSGVASGLNNTVARISGLMAMAILGSVLAVTFSAELERGLEQAGLSVDNQALVLAQSGQLQQIELPPEISPSVEADIRAQIDHALLYAYRFTMGINALFVLVSFMLSMAYLVRRQLC